MKDKSIANREGGDPSIAGRRGSWVGALLRWLVPVALTVLLLVYLFRKVDFLEMMHIIEGGVDYWWIILAMVLSIFSHMIRAARWRLQLDSLEIKAPFMALCCSIFGCYALNLLFPRLGEIWRCSYISRREGAKFTTVLGSMVADRLADTLTVAMLLLLSFIVAAPAINAFLGKYPIGRDMISLLKEPLFWVAIVGGCAVVVLLLRCFRHTAFVAKLRGWGRQLWEGFATVASMKGRGMFLLLTLLLWGCYFTQLYVAFYAFPFTRALCAEPGLGFGLEPCLVAFVLSSIGMAVPSNGGLGPWNIAVMFGLALYGISDAAGTAFSMLQWSGQTVMLIILGIFTLIYTSRPAGKKAAAHTSAAVPSAAATSKEVHTDSVSSAAPSREEPSREEPSREEPSRESKEKLKHNQG